jgi:hypothetical protein
MLITQLLMLLKFSKNTPAIILFLNLLINLDHIHYSCGLNLNGGFFYDVWFTTILIGWNQLCLIVDKLIGDFLDLKNKIFFNKTNQGVTITHMEEALVLLWIWMEVISH